MAHSGFRIFVDHKINFPELQVTAAYTWSGGQSVAVGGIIFYLMIAFLINSLVYYPL